MIFLYVILGLYSLTISTYIFYLAIMSLRKNKDKLTGASKVFGYQILFGGVMLDTLFNWTVGSLSFWEFPREFLFTARCDRWLRSETKRGKVARFYCIQLLDPFDINGHCR